VTPAPSEQRGRLRMRIARSFLFASGGGGREHRVVGLGSHRSVPGSVRVGGGKIFVGVVVHRVWLGRKNKRRYGRIYYAGSRASIATAIHKKGKKGYVPTRGSR